MDKIKFMAKFGATPQWLEGYNHARTHSPEGLDVLRAAWCETKGVIAELEAATSAIDVDDALTEKGRRQAKARAATRLKARMAAQKNSVRRAEVELQKLKARLTPDSEMTVPDALTAVAIWALLPEDALKVQDIYRRALDARDTATMRAIELLPSVHGGALPADQVVAFRLERLGQELAPEDAFRLEQFEDAVADTTSFTKAAARELLDAATGGTVEAQTAALHKSVEAQTSKSGKV